MDSAGWINWLTILLYLGTLAGIGVYFSRRQRNLEDFFLGGRGMGWIPVGMSLMAALNSGLDYIMQPFIVFKWGLIFFVGTASWLVLYPWVSRVTMPFYRRLNVLTAYEYLEQRFNGAVRTLAALVFLFWRLGWMATAVYAPSLAISALTGVPLLPTIVVLGACVTLYTMLGGITAIIWTDVLQFCVMLGGVFVTLAVIVWSMPGGLGGILSFAHEHGKTALVHPAPDGLPFWEHVRHVLTAPTSFLGIVIASVIGRLTMYTCEQSTIQRFQATRSIGDSRRAFVVNALGDTLWTGGLMLVGLALFAYFKGQPPADAAGNPIAEDRIVIHFMRHEFPLLSGLIVAAVLASGLSAIDAAINAGTSVLMVDFYKRFARPTAAGPTTEAEREQRRDVFISRVITVVFAVVGITFAANIHRLGNLQEIANRVIQTPTGPLLGLYLLGMFSTRASATGALVGGVAGMSVALFVAFGTDIGFIWPIVVGLVSTLVPGYVVSMFTGGSVAVAQRQLTWRNVMRRPIPDEKDVPPLAPAAAAV